MIRRAFLSFLPAFLALAFLCGTPGASIGGPESSATSWNTEAATSPVVRGSRTQDIPDGAINQRTDEDDTPDDRIVRIVSTVVWPKSAVKASILRAGDIVRPTHRPCAAPPRAPPTA